MVEAVARKPETFFEEMKRYVGLTEPDASLLPAVGPLMEPHFTGMAELFYHHILRHPERLRRFWRAQIAHLKQTLQTWPRGVIAASGAPLASDSTFCLRIFRVCSKPC